MAVQINDENDGRRIDLRAILKHASKAEPTRTEEEMLGAGSFQMLKLSSLSIDHRYQGHMVRSHINKLKREYDPRLVGVFMISRRQDGSSLILDGQHREAVLRELGHIDIPVGCIVLEGLSYEEEAYLYHKFNENRRKKTPQERIKSAIEAKESWALAVRDAVTQAGFRLNFDDSLLANGRIPGAESLIFVQTNYRPSHLQETLTTFASIWGTRLGPRAVVIRGIADFLSVYRGVATPSRLASCPLRLADPDVLARSAQDRKRILRISSPEAFSALIVEHYNDRLHDKNKIPSRADQVLANKSTKQAGRERGQ